jgi:hypothetical protein
MPPCRGPLSDLINATPLVGGWALEIKVPVRLLEQREKEAVGTSSKEDARPLALPSA